MTTGLGSMSYSRDFFKDILDRTLGDEVKILSVSPVSGGCIHHAQKITTDKGLYFIKLNQSLDLNMFRTEYSGLELLASCHIPVAQKVPSFSSPSGAECSLIHL